MAPLVLVQEDVDHGMDREGGEVMNELYPGYGSLSLQERVCLGLMAQLRSLHDLGLPLQLHPEGTHQVPCETHVDTFPAPDHPDKRGRNLAAL